MAVNHTERIRTAFAEASVTPLVLTGVGACFAIAIGLLLVGTGGTAAVLLPLAVGIVLLALWSPYWALVATLAQLAFIPCESELFGHFVPNSLQLLAPAILIAALLRTLKEADHERLAPRLTDLLVPGFILWGLVGMLVTPGGMRWKWFGNAMGLPALLYFAVRFLRLSYADIRRLIVILLIAISMQSVLMIRESGAGSSPIYHVQRGTVEGVKPAKGPFPFMWNASTYLALWPSLFVYAMASSRDWRKKIGWGAALTAVLDANTCTMERAGIAASLAGIVACLLSPRLRRTTLAMLGVLAVLYVPWSVGKAGGGLLDRFDQTDESRYAYRTAAINLLRSSDWNPIFGIGWGRFGEVSGVHGTEESIIAWGTHEGTVAEIAAGSKLHNVWLAVPVELGAGGALLFAGLVAGLVRGVFLIWRRASGTARVDDGLVVSMLGSLIALGAIAYYQNTYMMAESMSVLWSFYGLLTTHPGAFTEPKPGP